MDSDTFLPLNHDKSSPELPDWTHRAIADYATWLIYRNGNVQKQNRGQRYLYAFEEVLGKLQGMGVDDNGLRTVLSDKKKYFFNIPR